MESADEEQSARFRSRNRVFQDFQGSRRGFSSVRARNTLLDTWECPGSDNLGVPGMEVARNLEVLKHL